MCLIKRRLIKRNASIRNDRNLTILANITKRKVVVKVETMAKVKTKPMITKPKRTLLKLNRLNHKSLIAVQTNQVTKRSSLTKRKKKRKETKKIEKTKK